MNSNEWDKSMSADGVILYYGLRFVISDEAEVELLENLTHPKLQAAAEAGLQDWWGRTTDEEIYFLLIGTELGNLGWEGVSDRQIEDDELVSMMQTTKARLRQAGFTQTPALHAQFEPD
jgi:hypothetical protein